MLVGRLLPPGFRVSAFSAEAPSQNLLAKFLVRRKLY